MRTPPWPCSPHRGTPAPSSPSRWTGWRRRAVLAAAIAGCSLLACASDDDSTEDPGDGRFHPPPNGVHISEEQACTTLQDAFLAQVLGLGCSNTMRPCPTYLRLQFQTPCMEYDEGSVTGCVDYYRSITICAELDPTMCVVTPYPGTEPGGCPP